MTVNTTATSVIGFGNGATTVWPFSFIIPFQSDGITPAVKVSLLNTNVTPNIITILAPGQYAIAGVANPVGGTVTYAPALAVGVNILIERNLNFLQGTAILNQGFFPSIVETIADTLTEELQQLQNSLVGVVKAPIFDGGLDMTLPPKADRANKFFYFNLLGQPQVSAGIPSTTPIGAGSLATFLSGFASLTLADAMAVALGGALILDANVALAGNTTLNAKVIYFTGGIITRGAFNLTINGDIIAGDVQIFDTAGAGTVTIGAKQFGINIKWFGAKGDNVTDDYTAITKTFLTAVGSSQAQVIAPIGYYRTSRQIIASAVGLRGASKVGTNFSALQPFTGDSVMLVDDSVNSIGGDARYENFRIYGNRAQVNTSVAGLKLYGNVLYNTFTDIRIEEVHGPGIWFEGKAGPVRPTLNTFVNVHVNGGDVDALLMNAGRHSTFTDCSFENVTGKAINIQGTTEACSKLTFINPYCEHIVGDGIYLGAVDFTTLIGVLVNGYGATGTPSYGIRNGGAVANLNELLGGQFAKNAAPNAASHDVYVDGGVRFSGHRLATTDVVTVGNRGANFSNYQIAAASTNPLFFSNGRGTVAANTTLYLGANGAQNASRPAMDIPISGYLCLSQLRASSTVLPSGVETYTILVLVNGASTGITCQLSNVNSGRDVDLTNEYLCVPGDLLAVRVVSSAGATIIPQDGLVISIGGR